MIFTAWVRRWLAVLLWAACVPVVCLPALAHEISMAEMEVRQLPNGQFSWQWIAGHRAGDALLRPQWPEGCREDAGMVRCGEDGLRGWLGMQGVGKRFSAVIVKLHWQDGQTRVHTLTAGQPTVQLYGSADDDRGMGEIARAYTVMGFEHILGGLDHLLFVLGLLFLVGLNRKLVWALTAFTVAHSLTLALTMLGWLALRPPPVEAAIALSILLVASQALSTSPTPTWSQRWPAAVAFLFGLVHGLGFAGSLQQVGLPDQHTWAALLCFNLGVEAGQLLVVLIALVVARGVSGLANIERLRQPALYAMGSVAAYWTFGRVAMLVA
jgi:hydrogenase/urease accessory protein HupE